MAAQAIFPERGSAGRRVPVRVRPGRGCLIAAGGPFAIGLLDAATGGWMVPMAALLATVALQMITGGLACRGPRAAGPLRRPGAFPARPGQVVPARRLCVEGV
jgi:hypothetical protein